ncbi:MAG: hypothetical protein QXF26_06550 [Candidatus Bathyarchaeia archaeon]
MGLKDILKKKNVGESTPKQPRFFCSECKHELLLMMKYCDNCGGEIKWPEKYAPLITCESKG